MYFCIHVGPIEDITLRHYDLPQPYWRQGQRFLQGQINKMRGGTPEEQSEILADCFGVDVYGRLLVDLRGVHNKSDEEPIPTLNRFELAKRALLSGFAFPTNHHFVNQELWECFEKARRERRGAFSTNNGDPVIHPSLCRLNRHRMKKRTTRSRRKPYTE